MQNSIPMKTKTLFLSTFLIAVLIISAKTASAQTLDFSQVLYLSTTDVAAAAFTIGTVPANTVWKVVAKGTTRSSAVNVYIDGSNTGMKLQDGNVGSSNFPKSTHLPLWLPAGTVLQIQNNPGSDVCWFSIIEFSTI